MPYQGSAAGAALHSIAAYAARSKPATRSAIFHISSDNAMLDNSAVLSGSGSSDRVLAACGIGVSPRAFTCSAQRFPNPRKNYAGLLIAGEHRIFSSPSRQCVNFVDDRFSGQHKSTIAGSRVQAKGWSQTNFHPMSMNL
jgi:hypothetical protein